MIEIYDSNGQPYNADLVPGPQYRELLAALRKLEDLSRDRRQCRVTLRDAIASALARAESTTPGLRTDNPLADPVMGGLPRYEGEKLGAPVKHCAHCTPESDCWETGYPCRKQVDKLWPQVAAPAKHPDTVRGVLEQFQVETIRHAANAIFNKLSEVYSCGTNTEQGRQALFKAQRLADAIVASPNASAAIDAARKQEETI